MQHRDEWWVEVQWSSKGIQEGRLRQQQERLIEWERGREREMEWSALFPTQLQWQTNSSLTSVFTVYMSSLAARQLQKSVIIIYLFKMPKGRRLRCLAKLGCVQHWHIILVMVEITELTTSQNSIWRCNVAYSKHKAITHVLGWNVIWHAKSVDIWIPCKNKVREVLLKWTPLTNSTFF